MQTVDGGQQTTDSQKNNKNNKIIIQNGITIVCLPKYIWELLATCSESFENCKNVHMLKLLYKFITEDFDSILIIFII